MERILVIDDSEAVVSRVRAVLTDAGYEVTATTQSVGIARYLRQCDLVIIDYYMPGIDGQAVLESLKASAQGAGIEPLFYLYTSDANIGGRYRALGFDGYFAHKGDDEALVSQVRSAFRLRDLRRMRNRRS